MWSEVVRSCPTLATLWTVVSQTPLSMGFSRQEYWSGLPFPSPGDLPNPGIEPGSPALEADALTSEPPGKPILYLLTFHDETNTSLHGILPKSFNFCIVKRKRVKPKPKVFYKNTWPGIFKVSSWKVHTIGYKIGYKDVFENMWNKVNIL